MSDPTIEEVQSLDGKIFAMLTQAELEVYRFYLHRGRKFGVSVSVVRDTDSDTLSRAVSERQAEEILARSNGIVSVTGTDNPEWKDADG